VQDFPADLGIGGKPMNFYRHPFRPLATFAVALFVLVACQNATEPTNATGPIVANGTYTMGSSSRLPDSITWNALKDTGSQKPTCSATSLACSDTFHLSEHLGTDSLSVQLWTLGIRTGTIYFGEEGNSPILTLKTSIRRDNLDVLLLAKYDTATLKSSFSALGQGASSLVAYYAKLILAGDTSFKGKTLPVGMNADSVKKDLVYLGIQSGLTENQLMGLNVGLDSNAIRTFAGVLVNANLLRASDTTALLHPVRVATAASVSGSLTAGGAAVAVSGSFSWNTGVQVSLSRISIRTQNSGDSSKFQLSYKFNPGKTETNWSLSDNLTIQALASAPVGWDTLVIILSSDPTHSATVRVPFQVVAKDVTPPILKITSPLPDTASVPNSNGTIVVTASATDSGSGLDSIQIGNKPKHAISPCSDTISLVVGANPILVQAWDKAGNASTVTVLITRAPAPTNSRPPTVIHVSPLQDTATVPWGTRFATLSWTITGDTTIASVTLGEHALPGNASFYQTSVNLTVGQNSFALAAVDARGLGAFDTIRITRQADTSHPLFDRGPGANDTVLLMSQISYSPSWIVTDNALESVTINGFAATAGSGNTYSAPVTLSGDSLWIILVAKDSSRNTIRDSIKVRRLGPPTLTPVGGSLSGNQTVQVAVSSNLKDAVIQYSVDRSKWSAYTNALLVSKSQILYSRTVVGGIVSDIDSAIFVYVPTFAIPSGAYSSTQTVAISALGSPSIEDSLSTGTSWNAYTAPLTIDASAKLFARSRLGGRPSDAVEAEYAFAPTLSPSIANDTGVDSQVVTVIAPGADSIQISTDTGAAKTWTTLVGGSYTMVTGTLYARSRVGSSTSPLSMAAVQLFQRHLVFSPVAGVYVDTQRLTISSPTQGASIYFTMDGTTPTTFSNLYSDSIVLGVGAKTIKAISVKKGLVTSAVDSIVYRGTIPVVVIITQPRPGPSFPTLSPGSGTYSTPQAVTISCSSNSVLLRYSTDGGLHWVPYVSPVLVSSSETLSAIALNVADTSIGGGTVETYIISTIPIVNTFDSVTDSRDNQVYKSVTIGSQTWLAQNLNFAGNGPASIGHCYNDSASYCTIYGRLYSWADVVSIDSSDRTVPNRVQGICPTDWHVPSDSEWNILQMAVGSVAMAGTTLKSKSGWSGSGNGTDTYGFHAMPGGNRGTDGSFGNIGTTGLWWSIQNDFRMSDLFTAVDAAGHDKTNGFSLRCIAN
jgi:uncharacterized protein (TIGR02145 family)